MKTKSKSNKRTSVGPTIATLADILPALAARQTLSVSRRRDLCSSIKRVAFLLGDDPARIPGADPPCGACPGAGDRSSKDDGSTFRSAARGCGARVQ
jgi:hypothetical protein